MAIESNSDNLIQTWELLMELGFQADEGVYSDVRPGLSYHFVGLKLDASAVMSRCFDEVVMLTGVLREPRSVAMIESDIPRAIPSRQLGIAWIVWVLDQHASGKKFNPPNAPPWLEEGRLNRLLLPWEQKRIAHEAEMASYAKRPLCLVERDWMRLSLKKLAAELLNQTDQAAVSIEPAETGINFRIGHVLIPLHGSVSNWEGPVCIEVGKLRGLPKRLMNDPVPVGVWDGKLQIDRVRYALKDE